MKSYLFGAMMVLVAACNSPLYAQLKLHEDVDAREVLRRGDMVEHITQDAEDADPLIGALSQINSTPADDLDKWHISIVIKKNDKACEALLKRWDNDPILSAYAAPSTPRDSWSHFTVYDYEDPLQEWRWTPDPKKPEVKVLDIKAFPTIVVQPPRTGKYGNPNIVILSYIYQGDSEDFRVRINSCIKAYVKRQQAREGNQALLGSKAAVAKHRKGIGAFELQVFDVPKKRLGGFQNTSEAVAEVPLPTLANTYASNPAKGYGQGSEPNIGAQQYPPVNLPLDHPNRRVRPSMDDDDDEDPDDDEDDPESSFRNSLRGSLLAIPPYIVIVKDADEMYGEDVSRQINEHEKELQARSGKTLRVRKCDVRQARSMYRVEPEDTPAVLLVEGRGKNAHVIEKRSCKPYRDGKPDEDKGFVISMTAGLLIWLGMSFLKAYYIAQVAHYLVWAFIYVGLIVLVGFILVLLMRNSHQPPAVVPAPTADQIAASMIAQQQAANSAALVKPRAPVME